MTVISRTVAIVKSVALFNRHADVLFRVLKDNVVTIDLTGDLLINLDCTSRGAKFQKRLIACVDKLIRETIGGELEEPRVFSKKMIEDKLAEQKRKCPLCTSIITMAQKYEGDHILAWVNGGRTVKENLQVVHHACHKRKTT
jgi:hypothetical protein